MARLEELYAIGASRPGLTATEERACELAAGWMDEAGVGGARGPARERLRGLGRGRPGAAGGRGGLAVTRDPAGNVFGRLVGERPELPEVWAGSHLDTVPAGGRFDGALGVVGAIEAVAALAPGERTVAVVALRDEEGVRFGGGCFGSRAICGRLDPDELGKRDVDGVSIGEAL